MRTLTRSLLCSVSQTCASRSRTFASHAGRAHIDALHGFRPSNSTAAILTAKANNNWVWWHLPDVNIEERTARLSHTLARFQSHISDTFFVTVSGEVKGNPTESEADVAADRSDEDPLPPEKHHTIQMPAGDLAPKPTEAEEFVKADRAKEDPLPHKK